MNLFKSVDDQFAAIGFIKVREDKYGAIYKRHDIKYGYDQRLDLVHKWCGRHIIQSYESGVNKNGFNNVVGLSMYEARLALKKMKQMGWKQVRR